MRINPVTNQNSFKAINVKYFDWARKDIKYGIGLSGEVLTQIEMDVCWKDLHPQDAIDTLEAIKSILPNPREDIDRTLNYVKKFLP